MVVCAKCKQVQVPGSDSWCLACGAWEALETELGSKWHNPALRSLAEDTLVSAVRTIRSLRSLGASFSSAERARAAAVEETATRGRSVRDGGRERRDLPPPPPPPVPVKRQEESSGDEAEESEEEEVDRIEDPNGRPHSKAAPPRRPAEPDHPPRGHKREHSEENQHRSRRDKRKRKKGKKSSRGGRKHQRLYRSLEKPEIRLHRKISSVFWDKRPSLDGRPALPRRR